jgi:DNA mismatch repair ATPase MutS
MGAINLEEILRELKCDITYPKVFPSSKRVEEFKGLKDITLVLTKKSGVVSNDLLANDKDLFIITGANKGGKTSFVRALGVAQIFTQCGLFVTAKECKLNICQKIFTHFKKEEDSTLKSGKFDEELKRLNLIVDRLKPNSLMIFNESFSSTNEAEASLIAQEIIQALIDKRVKVFFVTHMYSFANSFYSKEAKNCIYLRAQRGDDGKRSYKITVSSPQPTSYASDIYLKVFGK